MKPSSIIFNNSKCSDITNKRVGSQNKVLNKISSLIDEIYSKSMQSESHIQPSNSGSSNYSSSSSEIVGSSTLALVHPHKREIRRSTGRFSERSLERSDESISDKKSSGDSKSSSHDIVDDQVIISSESSRRTTDQNGNVDYIDGVKSSPIHTDAYTVDRLPKLPRISVKNIQTKIQDDVKIDAIIEQLGSAELNRSQFTTNAYKTISERNNIASSNISDESNISDCDEKSNSSSIYQHAISINDRSSNNSSQQVNIRYHSPDDNSNRKKLFDQNQSTGNAHDYSYLRPRQSEPFTISEISPNMITPSVDNKTEDSNWHTLSRDIISFDNENSGPLQPLLEKVKKRSSLSILDPGNFGQDISEFLEEICTVNNDELVLKINLYF